MKRTELARKQQRSVHWFIAHRAESQVSNRSAAHREGHAETAPPHHAGRGASRRSTSLATFAIPSSGRDCQCHGRLLATLASSLAVDPLTFVNANFGFSLGTRASRLRLRRARHTSWRFHWRAGGVRARPQRRQFPKRARAARHPRSRLGLRRVWRNHVHGMKFVIAALDVETYRIDQP